MRMKGTNGERDTGEGKRICKTEERQGGVKTQRVLQALKDQ